MFCLEVGSGEGWEEGGVGPQNVYTCKKSKNDKIKERKKTKKKFVTIVCEIR
jgi:hypothetical protein